jgi:hypothetical protein
MGYLTKTELRDFDKKPSAQFYKSEYSSLQFSTSQLSIFLSHSHEDVDLVEGLIAYLAKSYKAKIYVDWKDSSMPERTSRVTADIIKGKIELCQLFMVLATNNAIKSRWVPWEIGVADSKKTPDNIFIIPVEDTSTSYQGSEYLQLYNRIEPYGIETLGIFKPNSAWPVDLPVYLQQKH